MYQKDDVSFYVNSMLSMQSDGSNDSETTFNDDATFGLRQLNLQIKGLIPNNKEAVIWEESVITSVVTYISLILNTEHFRFRVG